MPVPLALALAPTAHGDIVEYLHTDLLGSVVAVTDQAGAVIERHEYEPYGLPRSPIPDGPGYTGHDMDGNTGLIYAQQRYFDPEVGRFLSVDPVPTGLGSNFNRYSYAANNPYRYVDPDGRDCVYHSSGVTHCSVKLTGSNVPMKFNFETPTGFPNIVAESSIGHHYDIPVTVGSESDVDAAEVRRNIIDNPTPGIDMPATADGQLNDASPELAGIRLDALSESPYSPVLSLIATDHNGNDMVVNVTLPGHPVFPGIVARPVVVENGQVIIRNVGEGMALKQSKWSPIADWFSRIWNTQSQEIIDVSQ